MVESFDRGNWFRDQIRYQTHNVAFLERVVWKFYKNNEESCKEHNMVNYA